MSRAVEYLEKKTKKKVLNWQPIDDSININSVMVTDFVIEDNAVEYSGLKFYALKFDDGRIWDCERGAFSQEL